MLPIARFKTYACGVYLYVNGGNELDRNGILLASMASGAVIFLSKEYLS
ncbi:hypothetical protein [Sphingobacterium kitahiroshimense]|nr:hypothetical protein [Sphingobacterium kitahiroshimense]MCW2263383.1 hypothetical protein [Sphingobacterium kitahiroshimense]